MEQLVPSWPAAVPVGLLGASFCRGSNQYAQVRRCTVPVSQVFPLVLFITQAG